MPIVYLIEDVGELKNYSFDPAIQSGIIVGGQDASGGPFATSAGLFLPLGSVPGSPYWMTLPTPGYQSLASWANNATPNLESIVGFFSLASDLSNLRPCVWTGSILSGYSFQALPLPTDASQAMAIGVSFDGLSIFGQAFQIGNMPEAAVLWSFNFASNSWSVEIVSETSLLRAHAISGISVEIFGNAVAADGRSRAVRWVKGSGQWSQEELQTEPFASSVGIVSGLVSHAISGNGGSISGAISGVTVTGSSVEWGAIWNGTSLVRNFPHQSISFANSGRRAVGYILEGGARKAHVWDAHDGEQTLHDMGWEESLATGIDLQMNICGVAKISGVWRIVRWVNPNPLP